MKSHPAPIDARKWTWNGPGDDDEDYRQTWNRVTKLPKWAQAVIRWLCGLRGHEISATEWGYGGGDNVDCWCRWCNALGSVPRETARFMWETWEGWGRFQEINDAG